MTYVAKVADGIRSYGPGKFNNLVDSHVYQASLDGCDEDLGSCAEYGVWYGLIAEPHHIPAQVKDSEHLEPLNRSEISLLFKSRGVIIFEDDQGFVDVQYYETAEEMASDWENLSEEFSNLMAS